MKQMGLQGATRGGIKCWTTISDEKLDKPADLVNRQFVADRPNQLWVADITFVTTWSDFVHVAFVIDVFARYIVGWRVSVGHYAPIWYWMHWNRLSGLEKRRVT